MKRAYLMELTIFRDYFKQLLGIGFFVAIFVSFGMGSIVAAPAILTMMFFMMGTVAAAAYDEQSRWGMFRLTLPVSRRDVVLARYGVIGTLGVGGMLVASAACALLTALATILDLPLGLSDMLAFDPEVTLGSVFSIAFCMAIGALISGIETPIYFKLGQNKTTQWLPMITVLLFVGPFLLVNATGVFEDGAAALEIFLPLLSFIETPLGVAASFGIAAAFAAAVLGISATVSLKVYEGREL